jgi:hypothetical protein
MTPLPVSATIVMAGLVPAISGRTLPRRLAGTSAAMTMPSYDP